MVAHAAQGGRAPARCRMEWIATLAALFVMALVIVCGLVSGALLFWWVQVCEQEVTALRQEIADARAELARAVRMSGEEIAA